MANSQNEERARIRAARYTPNGGFYEVTEMTLNNLPRRKRTSFRTKMLAASSLAAALALLLVFTAPQIVQAATQLYQRLFGQVVSDIKAEQALPEDEKLKEMVADSEKWSRFHDVEGASAEIGGVTVSVASVRTMPEDQSGSGIKGLLDVALTYSKIPGFDPSWVDFTVVVDGVEIPMKIDGSFKDYRDGGGRTLTQAQWEDGWSGSNCYLDGGVPTTGVIFQVDDWQWEAPRALVLTATIDGQKLSIPFTFDPSKAHEAAIESAKGSVKRMEENYRHEQGELESMEAAAVPVGLAGSAEGYDWTISELSFANEKLYFTAAFGGSKEKNIKKAGMGFWPGDITVDGMRTGLISSDNDELKDGNYTAVYQCALLRDPGNLPEESIIKLTLEMGDPGKVRDVAFRYNWKEKKAALPRDEAQMQSWVDQAKALTEALYAKYDKNVSFDLTPLNLTQEKDGVSMTITGVTYDVSVDSLEFSVRTDGNTASSSLNWLDSPEVTINGYRCYDAGGSTGGGFPTAFNVDPPLNISEFGDGDLVVLDFPLYKKGAHDNTNYPEPSATLHYEFTIDKGALKPLAAD
jgi:hypothetical protein